MLLRGEKLEGSSSSFAPCLVGLLALLLAVLSNIPASLRHGYLKINVVYRVYTEYRVTLNGYSIWEVGIHRVIKMFWK